jgi:hypothetical protein
MCVLLAIYCSKQILSNQQFKSATFKKLESFPYFKAIFLYYVILLAMVLHKILITIYFNWIQDIYILRNVFDVFIAMLDFKTRCNCKFYVNILYPVEINCYYCIIREITGLIFSSPVQSTGSELMSSPVRRRHHPCW